LNASIFTEWFRRQGIQVHCTNSSYWYEASPRVYQAFPYHWLVEPDEREISEFIRQKRAIALRYSTPIESPQGCVSYHAIYNAPEYNLDLLDRRSRQNIRTGLRNCQVTQISVEQLAEEGFELEMDTAKRQRRRLNTDREAWRNRYLAAEDLPGFEAWGALVEGRLVASLFTFQMDDWCEMISQQCHGDFLSARVNNALTFVVTQTMIESYKVQGVFYALHSLDAPSSVDEFKFRMGYTARPVRQRVVFHPWLRPMVNQASHQIVKSLLRRDPASHTLAKAEGMIRFYLQGKKPLPEQDWPEHLSDQKESILAIGSMPIQQHAEGIKVPV
jgi:hypothetical protein